MPPATRRAGFTASFRHHRHDKLNYPRENPGWKHFAGNGQQDWRNGCRLSSLNSREAQTSRKLDSIETGEKEPLMNTRNRTLFVENLSPRQLMAIDIAEIEPNNTESQATVFQLSATDGVVLRGTSTSQNDKDYFAFTANASGPVKVGVSSNAGAKLEVTTRAGSQLFETEPKDGVNSGSFQTVAGTTYLLRMRAPDKAAANYAVTVSADSAGNSGGSTGGNTGGNPQEATRRRQVAQPAEATAVQSSKPNQTMTSVKPFNCHWSLTNLAH